MLDANVLLNIRRNPLKAKLTEGKFTLWARNGAQGRRHFDDCFRPTSCQAMRMRRTGCPPQTAFRMNALLTQRRPRT